MKYSVKSNLKMLKVKTMQIIILWFTTSDSLSQTSTKADGVPYLYIQNTFTV